MFVENSRRRRACRKNRAVAEDTHVAAHRFTVLSSAARIFGATPAAAEDKF